MTHPVFIEKDQGDSVKATVIGWPGLSVSAATRQEALARLRELLRDRLTDGEIVQLDVEPPGAEHPWLESAGIFENNPLFDEVLEEIEVHRRAIDAETRET
jgi:hypothetical protein